MKFRQKGNRNDLLVIVSRGFLGRQLIFISKEQKYNEIAEYDHTRQNGLNLEAAKRSTGDPLLLINIEICVFSIRKIKTKEQRYNFFLKKSK